MSEYRNSYAGKCRVCGQMVLAQQGWWSRERGVRCQPCSGHVEQPPTIKVCLVGQDVTFAPTSFLGGDKFNQYRQALSGTTFDRGTKTNKTQDVKSVPGMVQALVDAGFLIDMDPAVAAFAVQRVESVRSDILAATERADLLDQQLRTRGLGLYAFQRAGSRWLAGRQAAMLNDPMGLGKTIEALTAIPEAAPVLVVCPAVAKGVWQRETKKWRPELTTTILSGRGSFRWPAANEMVIANYDILSDTVPDGVLPGTVIIADEAHALKNYKSLRHKRFQGLANTVKAVGGRCWLLTATPLLNQATELWSLLQIADLQNEAFGGWGGFCRAFSGSRGRFGMNWGTPTSEAAVGLARVSLRREKADVLPEMPSKSLSVIPIDIAAKDARAIDRLIDDAGGREAIEKALKCAKDNNGSVNFEVFSKVRAALASAKITDMLEIVETFEEQNEPLVVFSVHRTPVDLLGTRPGWAVISGDTTADERTRIENDFQNGKLRGVACTIKAGGVAITLTHASNALFVDREWTPALNEQAEDRVHRIGQGRRVVIQHMVANHWMDQRIHDLLEEKTALIDVSVVAAARPADFDVQVPDVPVFDTEALRSELLASQARMAEESAKAQATAAAAAEKARLEAEKARLAAEERAKKEHQEKRASARLANAMRRGYVTAASDPARRPAASPAEHWAVRAIHTLSAADPDGAFFRNDHGFSKADVVAGHWLSQELLNDRGLTPGQWKILIRICSHYSRQVGTPPSDTVADADTAADTQQVPA